MNGFENRWTKHPAFTIKFGLVKYLEVVTVHLQVQQLLGIQVFDDDNNKEVISNDIRADRSNLGWWI